MKGRGGGAPSDLLVCFPSRAHLALMPKPICSPSRPMEPSKRHASRTTTRGKASPLFRTKTKYIDMVDDEPTSPKVTCAGQIKARPKPKCPNNDNWHSMVEEIEARLRKEKKRPNWLEALGLKKDLLPFLTAALRGSFRFNMGCFGSFPGAVDCTSDEEDADDETEEDSRTIFSKWFAVLDENHQDGFKKQEEEEEEEEDDDGDTDHGSTLPPPNALLLMRCRSAPAKGWLEGERDEEVSAKTMREEEKEKERMVLMSYAPDFFDVSEDIAKETWVVGSMDPLVRCRSWKR